MKETHDSLGLRGLAFQSQADLQLAPLIPSSETEIAAAIPTYERTGQYTYDLYGNTGNMPISTRGQFETQRFTYMGRERDKDQPDRKGEEGLVIYFQEVRLHELPDQDLRHPTGKTRRGKDGKRLLPASGESCLLAPGNIQGHDTTWAGASISCVATNTFEFGGANRDGEIYLFWIGPFPDWLGVGDTPYGPLGDYFLDIHNSTSSRRLLSLNLADQKVPPRRIGYDAIETRLAMSFPDHVDSGDVIRVELRHSCYGRTKAGNQLVGGMSGFGLIETELR